MPKPRRGRVFSVTHYYHHQESRCRHGCRVTASRVAEPQGRIRLQHPLVCRPCVGACFKAFGSKWRISVRTEHQARLASNDQSKWFDRFWFGVQLLQLRLVYQPTGPADSPLLRFHRECMRSASASVRRLPNMPKLGPRGISVDGGAHQGTKGGCDRANEYAENMLRAAARAHGPTTHYGYSALVPTPAGLHPMPAMVYADDDMVVTGDHVDIDPCFTTQRNALFLAGSAIPHAPESVCQVAEYKKSCVTAMHAGRAVPGPYTNAAGPSSANPASAASAPRRRDASHSRCCFSGATLMSRGSSSARSATSSSS